MACVVRVAVSDIVDKIDKPYNYVYPFADTGDLLGRRVMVPFGSGDRPRKGLILDVYQSEDTDRLKNVISVLDERALLDADRMELLKFLKEHYFTPYYACLSCLLPPALDFKIKHKYLYAGAAYDGAFEPLIAYLKRCKSAKQIKDMPNELRPLADKAVSEGILVEKVTADRALGDLSEKMISLAVPPDRAEQYMAELPARFQGQRDILGLLLNCPNLSVKEVVYMTGSGVSSLKTLEKNGLIQIYYQPAPRIPYKNITKKQTLSDMPLNDEQRDVFEQISAAFGKSGIHLIHGVTGSGKTHIYMKLIQRVMERGQSVLFMVPEISLTPQTLTKFYSLFGEHVAVIHSGLSMGERLDEWKKIQKAEQSIVVGTRSAVFAPIQNLGLIIMDEEHEASYKSEASPKFHARDIAKFLSKQKNVPLVLGSATPSVESYYSARTGKYKLYTLKKRFNHLPLPEVEMVDMRSEVQNGNISFLSDSLRQQMQQTLQAGHQIILFLNRRGAHTLVACQKCGYVLKCPNCGISMTYHSANNRCICHFCSYSIKALSKCPKCGTEHIKMTGVGTQLVQSELAEQFPEAKILRMDMDTVSGYTDYQTMLDAFAKGEYQILLGTQMVAKGLNFPGVTLVGVLQADQSLYIEDFRAGERTFSLLTQVCGRSGRADMPGKAVVQSYVPEHEILKFAENQDYLSFYEYEISFRKAVNYPPFCDLALFTITASSLDTAQKAAQKLFEVLEQHAQTDASDIPLRLLRPTVPRIAKVNDKYRVQLIVKCRNSLKLREIIRSSTAQAEAGLKVRISVDINPLSFF